MKTKLMEFCDNLVDFQVRRHGAGDNSRQDSGRRVLAQRCARHSSARACNRQQLQPYLSPEPAGRQEEGAEGEYNTVSSRIPHPFVPILPAAIDALVRLSSFTSSAVF